MKSNNQLTVFNNQFSVLHEITESGPFFYLPSLNYNRLKKLKNNNLQVCWSVIEKLKCLKMNSDLNVSMIEKSYLQIIDDLHYCFFLPP
jgi:hypothetical protein